MSSPARQLDPRDCAFDSSLPRVWFSTAPETGGDLPQVVFAAAEEEEPLVRCDAARPVPPRDSRLPAWSGVTGSLLLHAGVLLLCGMYAVSVRSPVEELVWTEPIRASLSDEEIVDIDPRGASLDLPIPAVRSAVERATLVADSFTPAEVEQKFSAANFEPAFENDEPEEHRIVIRPAEGKTFRYRKPGNGLAVTAGSFTVWTEPVDPIPRQPYMIVIQIRVPPNLETFPKSDLRIDIRGTDQFHLQIPDTRRNFALVGELDVIDGEVQLVIPVPGAPALVRDTIQVESRKILSERQRLEITF
jgi:hypothetical protein